MSERSPQCGACGQTLSASEVETFRETEEAKRLGNYYCSEHLQPALDGEYLMRVVVPDETDSTDTSGG